VSRASDRRSTSNSNTRGSAESRRRRRRWLVEHFGDGVHVACHLQISRYCEYVCDEDSVSPDRLVLGADGGSYRRSNIQPACQPCQREQGGLVGQARRRTPMLTPTSLVG